MDNPFKQAEETFHGLKTRLKNNEISRIEFLDELKKLQIKDSQGRLWMIGSQTGKWYYLKGKDWVQSEPPPPPREPSKALCPYCGFENKAQSSICARCGGSMSETADLCPNCGAKLLPPFYECPECRKREGEAVTKPEAPAAAPVREKPAAVRPAPAAAAATVVVSKRGGGVTALRSFKPLSFFFFGGALGLLAGLVFGAFVGATGALSTVVASLPSFFQETQGTIIGAIVFAALSAVLGFILLGLFFLVWTWVLNIILSLVGGVKVVLEETGAEKTAAPAKKTREALLDL